MFVTSDCFHEHSGLIGVFGGVVINNSVVQQSVSTYSTNSSQYADYTNKHYAHQPTMVTARLVLIKKTNYVWFFIFCFE